VRSEILSGEIEGIHATVRDRRAQERSHAGGVYKDDPHAAIKAILRASAKRVLEEDEPPLIEDLKKTGSH
jgi:hypothetical protein